MAKKRVPEVHPTEDRIQQTIDLLVARRDQAQAEAAALEEAIGKLLEIAGGKVTQIERPRTGPFRYAGLGVIEAIELYLGRKGSAADREELLEEVISGGAMVGRDPRYVAGNVKKSIDFNRDAEPPRLKELNGLVGLPAWPDEKFQGKD